MRSFRGLLVLAVIGPVYVLFIAPTVLGVASLLSTSWAAGTWVAIGLIVFEVLMILAIAVWCKIGKYDLLDCLLPCCLSERGPCHHCCVI